MDPARALAEVDLNLLVALDALLREESVSRAAIRLGRSQSTVSHALGRLRALLDDSLLIRDGRRMVLTPRAAALRGPLSRQLEGIERLLSGDVVFDAATSTRRFRLLCPDLLAPLLPGLWARLVAQAPGVGLDVWPPPAGDTGQALLGGAGELALGAVPEHGGLDLVVRGLGRLRWATALRADHPALAAWDRAAWLRWPHVTVSTGSPGLGFIGRAVADAGLERRVAMRVSSFLAGPRVAAGSDLLFSGPEPLLALLADDLGLTLRPVPLPLPAVPVGVMWSRRSHADPGHVWLRDHVIAAVSTVLSEQRAERGALPVR